MHDNCPKHPWGKWCCSFTTTVLWVYNVQYKNPTIVDIDYFNPHLPLEFSNYCSPLSLLKFSYQNTLTSSEFYLFAFTFPISINLHCFTCQENSRSITIFRSAFAVNSVIILIRFCILNHMSVNDKYEVIEGQFQMPPKVFQSLFGSTMELSVDNNHETSSTSSGVYDTNPLEK